MFLHVMAAFCASCPDAMGLLCMPQLVHRGGLRGRGGRDRRQVSALALGLRRSCLHLLSCSRSGWEAAVRLLLCMMSQCIFTLPLYL